MDYDKERFYNISTEKEFREFMKKADEVDTRDAMEPNEWKSACEYAGIKYSDYDNQDEMWEDLQYKLMILDVDNEFDEFIKRIERAYWEQWRYLALRHNIGVDLNGKSD